MKKTLLLISAVLTAVFTGCTDDEQTITSKGMTLRATVEQTATRATMDGTDGTYDDAYNGKYTFAFTANDQLYVTNGITASWDIFTYNGEEFSSADAQPTTEATTWYAHYPSNNVVLKYQEGTLSDVARYYASAGQTAEATTGTNGLTITLQPQVAILRIVKAENNATACNINIRTADGKYIDGLSANLYAQTFTVSTTDNESILLTKTEPGVYYIVVPAGVQLSVYNGDTKLKSTKASGLSAGKYYTITTAPTTGTATATIDNTEVSKNWVQLWAGGPKFATENVANKLTWEEAAKTGTDYVWGSNWRTPTKDEVRKIVNTTGYTLNTNLLKATYCQQDGSWGFLLSGVQLGYTANSIFMPVTESGSSSTYGEVCYWTSSEDEKDYGRNVAIYYSDGDVLIFLSLNNKAIALALRPILNE